MLSSGCEECRSRMESLTRSVYTMQRKKRRYHLALIDIASILACSCLRASSTDGRPRAIAWVRSLKTAGLSDQELVAQSLYGTFYACYRGKGQLEA